MLSELRVTPIGSQGGCAHLVADVLRIVSDSDLQYQVHGMGTIIEGELDEILNLLRRCHEEIRKHSDRVLIELSIDDRGGAEGELLRSVERVHDIALISTRRLSG